LSTVQNASGGQYVPAHLCNNELKRFPFCCRVGCSGGGGLGSPVSCLISEMDSHGGEGCGRTAEALCLEVRPLQRATLGVRLAHRKAFSLDYMDTHRKAHYRERYSPQGFSHLLFPDCAVLTGHVLRSTASQQASTSPCHRISPPAQPSYSRAMMLSRRSDLDPVRSDIIRGSREDQGTGSSYHRAPLMSLSSSEGEQEVGELAGRVTSSLLTPTPTGDRRLSKRERKRLKSLRRRQRRRERCRQSQQQENAQVKHKHTYTSCNSSLSFKSSSSWD